MDKLQFNCTKSGFKLGIWIFLGFIALGALKGAISNYIRDKDSFYIVFMVLSLIGLVVVGYTIRSYYKYKSVVLEVAVNGNDFSMINKDENGLVIEEAHLPLDRIHRAWILSRRSTYKLVVVLSTNKSDEQRIDTVPSQLYDIEETQAKAILGFIYHHNPSVTIGYM